MPKRQQAIGNFGSSGDVVLSKDIYIATPKISEDEYWKVLSLHFNKAFGLAKPNAIHEARKNFMGIEN
ncbi:MAG: hypothetical protein OXC26_15695 [Albidovulum sp.]|nr:hypothetical protein [Albidovulum sp.]